MVTFFIFSILALISILTWLGGSPLTYDEPWYLDTVHLIEKYGFHSEFLRELPGPAGPLYSVLHYLCKPFTHLTVPGVRWVNPILTLLTVFSLYLTMKLLKLSDARSRAFSVFAVPIVWSCTGLALTEISAVCAYSIHLFFFFKAVRSPSSNPKAWAILSGIFLGLSILGRQPILGVFLGLSYYGWIQKEIRALAAVTMGAALVICLPVFVIWQGLVPHQSAGVSNGFILGHMMVGLNFSALIFLILAPRFLILSPKIVGPILLASASLNIWLGGASILPMARITGRWTSSPLAYGAGQLWIGLLTGLGFIFLASALRQNYLKKSNPVFTFLLLCAGTQIAAMGAVTHQASNRYLMTAVPALILISSFFQIDKFATARFFIGAMVGALTLISHLGS